MATLKDMKVVFMGTPEFSVPILESLIETTDVVLVVSQPDKEVGRKKVLTPSPVKMCAESHGIKVLTPNRIKEEYEAVLNAHPDIIITCAYGQIVPKVMLDYPEYGCINVHASILPKYRGASPIQSALLNGDKTTGVTIMYMDEEMDTGNIIHSKEIEIDELDNYKTLSDKLSILGRDLLISVLPKIQEDENFNIPQDNELATYTKKIKREDERLDFNNDAKDVYNKIRAFNPTPLANTIILGEEWKIIEAEVGNETKEAPGTITNIAKDSFSIACNDKEIVIKKVKPFGKKEMLVKDLFNGFDKSKLENKKVGE